MKSRLFSMPLTQSAIAVLAVVVLSLTQVRAQDLDEAIDEELDSTTQVEPASEMDKADDLEELDLDEPAQAAQPAATPAPSSAQGELEEEIELDDLEDVPEEKVAEPAPVIDEPMDLDPEPSAPQPVVEEPMAPEPTIDEPNVEEPIVSEPTIDEPMAEPPPAIAKEPPPASDDLFDAPNTAFEKRLHDIVNGVRSTDDVSWDDVVGDRRAEIYPVQAGDTLWDLSQTFFGDGFFWGKLWSENGTIENPHDIAKGQAIRFVAGSEDAPPAIGVAKVKETKPVGNGIFKMTTNEKPAYREDVEGEITLEEVESGIALETAEIIPAPTLPPPSKRIPLLKQLPASFVSTKSDPTEEGFDLSGIKGAPAIRANEPANVILSSYAVDREPESLGKVDEIEASERFAGVGQYVILRLNRDIKVGMRVTFVMFRPRPSGAPGPIVDVRGVGTITGIVNENRNAYRALVTTSLDPIEKGSVVLEEPPPRATYSKDGPRGEADVKVLGAEYDNSRRVIGLGSTVYLSGGQKAGLRRGEILGVMSMRESRFRDTRYPYAATPIASIRVVDVREKVATAIVLEAGESIAIGDRTSGEMPGSRPPISTETAAEATAFGSRDTDKE